MYTEFYCQTTGSNLNAGSTTSDAATITYASGNWVQSTGVFTVASGDPSSDGVAAGDWASVYADGSTATGFVGRVTARDATTVTVSLTAKGGTAPTDGTGNRTLKVGGAWKGPNGTDKIPLSVVNSAMTNASGDPPRVNLKADTYSVSSATTVSGAGPFTLQGYTSSPGDGGRFTLAGAAGAAFNVLQFNGARAVIADAVLDCSAFTSGASIGLYLAVSRCEARRVTVTGSRGSGFRSDSNSTFVECEAYDSNRNNAGTTGGFLFSGGVAHLERCVSAAAATANGVGYFLSGNGTATLAGCVAHANGSHGLSVSSGSTFTSLSGCEFYDNAGSGVSVTSSTHRLTATNCNFAKNGAYGVSASGSTVGGLLLNCGFGAGTMANTSGAHDLSADFVESGSVTYAADVTPWADPDNGDFRITLAAARGAGRGAFTQTRGGYSGTVGYPDIGAAQHQDSGGGGGLLPLVNNIVAG